jgi:hypothetical protein
MAYPMEMSRIIGRKGQLSCGPVLGNRSERITLQTVELFGLMVQRDNSSSLCSTAVQRLFAVIFSSSMNFAVLFSLSANFPQLIPKVFLQE